MNRVVRIIKRFTLYLAVATAGLVGGILLFYVHSARSGPALRLWHTETLTAEFTASRADQVRSWEDYLRLEDVLFTELDERIYQQTETGPEWELARYSAGSAADPRQRNPDWNRSFEMAADDPAGGVLLLHGMTDSPYSLRSLGESLNQRGYWVIGLRLPGHGTAPSGLLTATRDDMAAAVRLAMRHLQSKSGSRPLHMVGYSTGATLALDYVLDSGDNERAATPSSLVLISPSVAVTPAAALAAWKQRVAKLPGLEKLAWTQIVPEFDPFKYNSFTANAGEQVHRLTRSVVQRIGARAAPGPIERFPATLVFLSTVDATVSTDAVIDHLLGKLAPASHELLLFDLNRSRVKQSILVSDPGPLSARLLADSSLPFHLALITNRDPDDATVVSRRKGPFSTDVTTEPLDLAWPSGVISLSHVALPFPPDDPLYGKREFAGEGLHLGQIDFQGERNLLKFPADWLLRLRYNPFYRLLEERTIQWIDEHSTASAAAGSP
jgi:alpha-beta hydrolase superfamily lysophospholipase